MSEQTTSLTSIEQMKIQSRSYVYTCESKRLRLVMYIPCLSETNVYGIFAGKFHGNLIVQSN
jgi:hypothetical protein